MQHQEETWHKITTCRR